MSNLNQVEIDVFSPKYQESKLMRKNYFQPWEIIKCSLVTTSHLMLMTENKEESLKGDSFEVVVFSYATFFFCSRPHIEEYIE